MISKKICQLAAKGNQKALMQVLEAYEQILRSKATIEGVVDEDLYESLVLDFVVHLPQVDL